MATAVTTDYTGRTVDLETLQTIKTPAPPTSLQLTLRNGGVSRRITGIQKLAQRYATIFLTQKGTVGYAATQGSNFIGPATGGLIANGANLTHFFNVANFQTLRQLQKEDSDPRLGPTPPDDERILTATLLDFEVNQFEGKLSLKVSLTSLAGQNYTYVLPAI
jgi:hypothetical protein